MSILVPVFARHRIRLPEHRLGVGVGILHASAGFRQTTDHIGCLCTGIAVRIGKRSPTSQRMPGSTSDAAMGLRPQHSSPSASSLRFARSSMSEHLHRTCMSGELGCPHETQVVPVHDAHRSIRMTGGERSIRTLVAFLPATSFTYPRSEGDRGA
jgi:hypothetical protein